LHRSTDEFTFQIIGSTGVQIQIWQSFWQTTPTQSTGVQNLSVGSTGDKKNCGVHMSYSSLDRLRPHTSARVLLVPSPSPSLPSPPPPSAAIYCRRHPPPLAVRTPPSAHHHPPHSRARARARTRPRTVTSARAAATVLHLTAACARAVATAKSPPCSSTARHLHHIASPPPQRRPFVTVPAVHPASPARHRVVASLLLPE
jgi:hypothetical protein